MKSKRFITSVLRTSETQDCPLPWSRAAHAPKRQAAQALR